MRNTLQHFREDYNNAIAGIDPTLTLPGLYTLSIVDQADPALEDAVRICPVNVFEGEQGNRRIRMDDCIQCAACLEVAPNAIEKVAVPRAPQLVPIG